MSMGRVPIAGQGIVTRLSTSASELVNDAFAEKMRKATARIRARSLQRGKGGDIDTDS